jgi:hypothetical protein
VIALGRVVLAKRERSSRAGCGRSQPPTPFVALNDNNPVSTFDLGRVVDSFECTLRQTVENAGTTAHITGDVIAASRS